MIATKKGFTYLSLAQNPSGSCAMLLGWPPSWAGLVCLLSTAVPVAQSPPSPVFRCPVHTASVWVTDGARVAVSEYTDHESEIPRYGPLKCFQSYELVQRCTILTQPILMKPLEYGCHAVPYSDPILCPETPLKWPHGTIRSSGIESRLRAESTASPRRTWTANHSWTGLWKPPCPYTTND